MKLAVTLVGAFTLISQRLRRASPPLAILDN